MPRKFYYCLKIWRLFTASPNSSNRCIRAQSHLKQAKNFFWFFKHPNLAGIYFTVSNSVTVAMAMTNTHHSVCVFASSCGCYHIIVGGYLFLRDILFCIFSSLFSFFISESFSFHCFQFSFVVFILRKTPKWWWAPSPSLCVSNFLYPSLRSGCVCVCVCFDCKTVWNSFLIHYSKRFFSWFASMQ